MLVQPHHEVLHAPTVTRSNDAEDLTGSLCACLSMPRVGQLEQPRGWLRVMYRLFIDWSRRYERAHVASMEVIDVLNM